MFCIEMNDSPQPCLLPWWIIGSRYGYRYWRRYWHCYAYFFTCFLFVDHSPINLSPVRNRFYEPRVLLQPRYLCFKHFVKYSEETSVIKSLCVAPVLNYNRNTHRYRHISCKYRTSRLTGTDSIDNRRKWLTPLKKYIIFCHRQLFSSSHRW